MPFRLFHGNSLTYCYNTAIKWEITRVSRSSSHLKNLFSFILHKNHMNRTFPFATYAAITFAMVLGSQSGGISAETNKKNSPVRLTQTPKLFVDDVELYSTSGVRRRVHACQKLPRPVLEPKRPWEGNRIYLYGSVHYDETKRRFRMWYQSFPKQTTRDKRLDRNRHSLVMLAESEDGVHWQRPELGRYKFAGSKKNNIVYDLNSPSILVDSHDPDPNRRFKMIGEVGESRHDLAMPPSAFVAFSANGIDWTAAEFNPLFTTGDTITWTRNPKTGEYLAFHKFYRRHRGFPRRMIYLTTSRDLKN